MVGPQDLDEFASSIPIDKVWRHRVRRTEDTQTVWFGILDTSGTIHRFVAPPERVTEAATELQALVHLSRHLAANNDPKHFVPRSLPVDLPIWPDGLVAPYVGCNLKLLRARDLIEDAADLIVMYGKRASIVPVKVEEGAVETTWKITFSPPPPAGLTLLVGDAIHNLRSALDILVCDLARINGKSTKSLKFPFAESEDALKDAIKKSNHRNRIGDKATDAIEALRPFKGGNLLLRGLHEMDLADKHRLILPTFVAAWHKKDWSQWAADEYRKAHPETDPESDPKFIFEGDEVMSNLMLSAGELIKRPTGVDPLLYLTPQTPAVEARFSRVVADMPFANQPVFLVLSQLHELVQKIIRDFEATFPLPA